MYRISLCMCFAFTNSYCRSDQIRRSDQISGDMCACISVCLVSMQVQQWVNRQTREIQDNFDEIKALVEEPDTWEFPEKTVTAVEPLLMLLRLFDGDTPCLGKVLTCDVNLLKSKLVLQICSVLIILCSGVP